MVRLILLLFFLDPNLFSSPSDGYIAQKADSSFVYGCTYSISSQKTIFRSQEDWVLVYIPPSSPPSPFVGRFPL